mmetsp:Transcript_25832/g.85966  ORF Transcript_25832/g.85966 Transcript_25832/m.85966 type:complete len:236 (-) Transcript_25832:16-723(-)
MFRTGEVVFGAQQAASAPHEEADGDEDVVPGLDWQQFEAAVTEPPNHEQVWADVGTMFCDLSLSHAALMRGENDAFLAEAARKTGAMLEFLPGPTAKHMTLKVSGPILNVYWAHALMMGRYHEVDAELPPEEFLEDEPAEDVGGEAQDGEMAEEPGALPGAVAWPGQKPQVDRLRTKIEELQRKLEQAEAKKSHGKDGKDGKGKPGSKGIFKGVSKGNGKENKGKAPVFDGRVKR